MCSKYGPGAKNGTLEWSPGALPVSSLCEKFLTKLRCAIKCLFTPSYLKANSISGSNFSVLKHYLFTIGCNFLMDHEVLTTLQSGFISGDSTVNQLVDIYSSLCRAIDEGKEVRAIFCDISKPFD